MRRMFAALVMALFVAAVAGPGAQTDVSGNWTLTINGPQGVIDTTAAFTQQGDKVTGTFSGPAGEAAVSGTMSGSTLTLAFNVVTQQGPMDIKMTAEVAGAEMKGSLDFGMGVADFTGKKQ